MATSGGQPGNKNAVKGRPWREALDRALKRTHRVQMEGEGLVDRTGRDLLDRAALQILLAAAHGDLDAMKELANRLDGRPVQAVEMEVTDSTADRLQAAEERLRRLTRTAVHVMEETNQEDPEWLQ